MKRILLLLLLAFISLKVMNAQSGKLSFKGYSGGMMLHTGYVSGSAFAYSDGAGNGGTARVSGMPVGIGGAVRFHFGEHLRIGSEGYSSSVYHGKYGSHYNVSWGGLLADYVREFGKISVFAGATAGGGGVKNLLLFDDGHDDFILENRSLYRKYTIMVLSPFLGMEYRLSDKLRLVLKADYLTAPVGRQDDFATGIRIYFGMSFYKM